MALCAMLPDTAAAQARDLGLRYWLAGILWTTKAVDGDLKAVVVIVRIIQARCRLYGLTDKNSPQPRAQPRTVVLTAEELAHPDVASMLAQAPRRPSLPWRNARDSRCLAASDSRRRLIDVVAGSWDLLSPWAALYG